MNILLIHNFYKYTGGEDIYVKRLFALLSKKHNVYLYAKNNKLPTLPKSKILINMFQNNSLEFELNHVITKFKPDIAHFHNVYPLISPQAYIICHKYKIPIVQTIHNYRFMCPKSILFRNGEVCELCVEKKFFYPSIIHKCYQDSVIASGAMASSIYYFKKRNAFDYIDLFLFPSHFTRDYYIQHLGLPTARTEIVPYYIESGITIKNGVKILQEKYFLFVGRLAEEKGIMPLLKLFATLPQYNLVVIGDGPLRNQVSQYKKYRNIIIKGFLQREKIFDYIQNALCVIIPSLWYEVLPMVLLESFSKGTPVIVPKLGSFPYLVKDVKTGLFFNPFDFNDIKRKIEKIYDSSNLVIEMRRNVIKEYSDKYTKETHLKNLLNSYSKVIRN